jgi:hypothetical protein
MAKALLATEGLTFGVGQRSMAELALGVGFRAPSCDPLIEAGLVNKLWAM